MVPSERSPEEEASEVDAAIQLYQQGDVVQLKRFVLLDVPVDETRPAATVVEETEGAVLLTQTCDAVRSVASRPYVQVAPLVRILDAGAAAQCREARIPVTCGSRRLAATPLPTSTRYRPLRSACLFGLSGLLE